MARDETIPRTTMVDVVTKRLRRDLLTGAIEPGSRILIGELEQRFGVSHIPIREALRRLEVEGLVVTSPQRATLAASIDLDDLAALYDLRRLIEVPVAKRAAMEATDEQVNEVEQALGSLEDATREPDSDDFWEHHRAFHSSLLAPGTTDWLQRVLDQVWQSAERYVRITVSTFGTMQKAMLDHRAMTTAFAGRDGDRLAELLDQHLANTELTLQEGFIALRGNSDADAEE